MSRMPLQLAAGRERLQPFPSPFVLDARSDLHAIAPTAQALPELQPIFRWIGRWRRWSSY